MNRWEDNEIRQQELELKQRFRARSAPEGFADLVMARVREESADAAEAAVLEFRPSIWRSRRAWVAVGALAASMLIGLGIQQRRAIEPAPQMSEAELAEAELIETLQLAGLKFNDAADAAFGDGNQGLKP